MVVEKAFVEAAGKKFGTVDGGTMCSGPFKLDSWKTGQGVTIVKNAAYWDTAKAGRVAQDRRSTACPTTPRSPSAFLTGELTATTRCR